MSTNITKFGNAQDLKAVLAKEHMKQVQNFFGDEKQALEFFSNVAAAVQRNPKLLECEPATVINSFMTMASLKLMPSGVSGEAFVIPYRNDGVQEAQFQLGYKGLVTLLYRAGNREVVAELVRDGDKFAISRGKIVHEVDPRKTQEQRGRVIGAYAIITTPLGGTVEQYMTIEDIQAHAQKFSKSFNSKFSPWGEANDPQGWMPRKTVLIQACKLAPKSGDVMRAIAEDYKDSVITDRRAPGEGIAKLAAPAEDLDFYRTALKGCTTQEAFERVHADMPASVRTALKKEIEDVKAMIMSEAEPEIV